MPEQHTRIVAVGLLTESDLQRLGNQFDRWYPVNETPCFGQLLAAIDEADRAFLRERDQMPFDGALYVNKRIARCTARPGRSDA